MAEIGVTNEILESLVSQVMLPSYMVPILCGNHISFHHFFALVVVRDPHFCVKLKMCTNRLHIIGQMGFKK